MTIKCHKGNTVSDYSDPYSIQNPAKHVRNMEKDCLELGCTRNPLTPTPSTNASLKQS